MKAESNALFLDFDAFTYGAMVSECRCDGVMEKRSIRLFAEIPVVTDLAVCDRCGTVWDGRIE